jgi:hypothetical protein
MKTRITKSLSFIRTKMLNIKKERRLHVSLEMICGIKLSDLRADDVKSTTCFEPLDLIFVVCMINADCI